MGTVGKRTALQRLAQGMTQPTPHHVTTERGYAITYPLIIANDSSLEKKDAPGRTVTVSFPKGTRKRKEERGGGEPLDLCGHHDGQRSVPSLLLEDTTIQPKCICMWGGGIFYL